MSNPLFQSLGGAPNNMFAALNQLKANPAAVLQQAGYNVPGNLTSPQQIINHLLQTGQLNRGMLGQLQQMAQNFHR